MKIDATVMSSTQILGSMEGYRRKMVRHWLRSGIVSLTLLFAAASLNGGNAEASHGSFYWEGGYNWNGEWVTCLHSGTTHAALFCW